MATVLQVRAARNVQTVIHLAHQVHIRIQINHLTHNQKPILDIHHSQRLVQMIHFHVQFFGFLLHFHHTRNTQPTIL